jgi:NTP pyrophosphatase (non-canonical NTP hydrolase)
MITTLQSRAAIWHTARFPTCTAEDIGLKAASELGEVADAILAHGRDASHPERAGDLAAEAADVVICLLALCGRFTEHDLLASVSAKLELLETRGGTHAASLPA